MRKPTLTGKRAVGLGLLATPVLVVAAVATLGVAGSSAGPAIAQADPAPVITQTAVSAASVVDYWTPAKMAAAAANPLTPAMAAGAAEPEIAGDSATGPPGLVGGAMPGGQAIAAPSPSGIPQTSGGQLPANGPYPGAKVSFKWDARYVTFPQGTVGKMFFTQDHDSNGVPSNFSCSGAALFIVRLDSVQVAGHCMHNGNGATGFNGGPGPGWSYNILFCPSYLNGSNPLRGCWAWDGYGIVAGNWHADGSFDRDWGLFRTASTGTVHAAELINVTGGLGFAWNQGRSQEFWNWGYPGLPSGAPWNFDGGDLVLCTGEHRYDIDGGVGPSGISMGCGSGRGSSGGPWAISVGNNGNVKPFYINSVNSWIFLAEEGFEIQGPYSDTTACNVMKPATGWGGTC